MKATISEHEEHRLSLGRYITGFVFSIGLTLLAYLLVTHDGAGQALLIAIISGLAIVQFVVQMLFFLHVGDERGPRWKLAVMCLMLMVVLILVFGSLWIMNNLNYRMTPQQMLKYMQSQDNL